MNGGCVQRGTRKIPVNTANQNRTTAGSEVSLFVKFSYPLKQLTLHRHIPLARNDGVSFEKCSQPAVMNPQPESVHIAIHKKSPNSTGGIYTDNKMSCEIIYFKWVPCMTQLRGCREVCDSSAPTSMMTERQLLSVSVPNTFPVASVHNLLQEEK